MRRTLNIGGVYLAGVLTAAAAGGCAGNDAAAGPPPAGAGGPAALPVISGEGWGVRTPRESVYGAVEREGVMRVQRERAANGDLVVRRRTSVDGTEAESTLVFAGAEVAAGTLALRSLSDADGQRLDFDPPAIVLPAFLAPGQEIKQGVQVTITRDGKSTVSRGESVVRYVTEQSGPRQVLGGPVAAAAVEGVLTMDVSGANVERRTVQWFAEGLGPVEETRSLVVRVLGFPVKREREAWKLVEVAPH